ncbi:molecular chaperone [Dyella sp. C9]|uniref:fimbrial biogenesis chaperone n=1 Tax=Dyella sp. C9 TaxID=2202154 RepID=UPI0018E55D3F|nr:molecular chaperone [Dyella sp. C9]
MKPAVRRLTWTGHLLWGMASLLGTASVAHAGLLAASTRVIYHEGDRERALMLANTNDYPILAQTWVDDGTGDPESVKAPFVVLPAVFRMEAHAVRGIRLLYNGDPLPHDRETVFWLNLYEIPPTRADDTNTAKILLAMNTQLKVFYRPDQLPIPPDQMASRLQFSLSGQPGSLHLTCHNPTPYHASFGELSLVVDGQAHPVEPQADMMTRPFDSHDYGLATEVATAASLRVRFTLLDDQGYPQPHEATIASH